MYREITIGKKSIPMKATAATPVRYRHVFHQDVLTELAAVKENNYGLAIDTISKLAFIMAKAADGTDMTKLNEDAFYAWLEGFGPNDIMMALGEVMELYNGNTATTVSPKKKNGQ
jgi:hypothetical protein